jgi:hypothetical protein
MESFPCESLETPEEIEAFAIKLTLESGGPDADPAPLIAALQNMPAIEAAMEDPYWADLVSIENYKQAGMEYDPITGEVTYTEETE